MEQSDFTDAYRAYARAAKRNHEKNWLCKTLEPKDKKTIWAYCYQRATRKDMTNMITDLIVYGRGSIEISEEKAKLIMARTTWWALRLERICRGGI
jgi:hypothetical protein